MSRYYDNTTGYFNAKEVIDNRFIFEFITGARGIGKTFSCILELVKRKKNFIYLRRTQTEADLQAGENSMAECGKVLNYLDLDYEYQKVHKNVSVCLYPGGKIAILALSTFAKIRGIDFSDYDFIIYDEFITEPHVPALKMEGLALSNLYESISRNREIEGHKPVKLICLSNSLNIANEIFIHWDLIGPAEELSNAPDHIMDWHRADTLLVILKNSPISEKKKTTALYRNAPEEYAKMALSNKFILNDFTYVQHENIRNYRALFKVGNLYVYRHKSEISFYVSFKHASVPQDRIYKSSSADLKRFQRKEWKYWTAYLDGMVRFENYKCIALYEKYFGF